MNSLATQALVGLAVLTTACVAERAPDPPALPGFGLVGCLVVPDAPGPSFRMTINDQSDQMIVRTSLSDMYLPRDEEMTDDFTHVAVLTDGHRSIAVTLDQELRASVLLLGGPSSAVSTGAGQCEPI